MSIKKIIDTEKWNAKIFDSVGKHNLAPYHNASLDRVEAAVMKHIAELETKVTELGGLYREVESLNLELKHKNDLLGIISNRCRKQQ